MAQHHRRWFRAPARCRSETGGQFSRWGPAGARHPGLWGSAPRREPSHRWGLNRRGPAGRCAGQRSAFQAVPALFCCLLLLGFAALRAAVGRHPAVEEYAPRREPSHGWGLNRRGPAGRCADRRSAFQAVPALFLSAFTRFRSPAGRCRAPSWSLGVRAERGAIAQVGSEPPRPCGPLCRPPPGELARVGVPSGPRAFSRIGDTRFRCAALRCYRTVSI